MNKNEMKVVAKVNKVGKVAERKAKLASAYSVACEQNKIELRAEKYRSHTVETFTSQTGPKTLDLLNQICFGKNYAEHGKSIKSTAIPVMCVSDPRIISDVLTPFSRTDDLSYPNEYFVMKQSIEFYHNIAKGKGRKGTAPKLAGLGFACFADIKNINEKLQAILFDMNRLGAKTYEEYKWMVLPHDIAAALKTGKTDYKVQDKRESRKFVEAVNTLKKMGYEIEK